MSFCDNKQPTSESRFFLLYNQALPWPNKLIMKILKFGGTSVGSPENIKKVIEIIVESKKANNQIAVVVSAFSKITDQLLLSAQLAAKDDQGYKKQFQEIEKRHLETVKKLIDLKNQKNILQSVKNTLKELDEILTGISLLKECSPRTLDLIASFGERLSAYIITQTITSKIPAEFLDSRKLVKTNKNFTAAKVDTKKTYQNIKNYFAKNSKLQIVTGFIGSTENDETTTLGRGGSDLSASLFGAALDAEEIEIWTDVDGVMTADPRKVSKAFSLSNMTYEEAMELSHFGAKVIYAPTMQPALEKNIPLRIKNTLNPSFAGTVISSQKFASKHPIKGISSINNISLLRLEGSGMVGVSGVSQRLFSSLAKEKINVILITQASSEHSICFAIKAEQAEKAKQFIEEEFKFEIRDNQINPVIVENELCIMAVVGENMRNTPGISGKVFQALGKNNINIKAIAQGSSELNISIVIPEKDEDKAISAIHEAFFLSETQTLNIFVIGTGLIGSTLLEQIEKQYNDLLNNQLIDLKITGLANSKKIAFGEIDLKNWQKLLEKSPLKSNVKSFTAKMKELNLPNSIFVDCTSSEEVASFYPEILKNSISIVTPNKKANSGPLQNYLKLSLATSKSNAKFLYETNVGAGLPVISTLHDLQHSGDQIVKIEAVLSGTLSYIFNNFDGQKSFTEIVKQARDKGYTEPDPRDDLNGLDVGRKLLILARETGQLLELKDIEIENLIPETCRKAKTVEDFFVQLSKNEVYFQKKISEAKKQNQKLCYIASIEKDKAKVSLESIDISHPFYGLSGSDNIISFTTYRYCVRPLVIKGPGAGAEVTAAGVFADILKIASRNWHGPLMRNNFAKKLKENKLVITLIGMSNIGKTLWAKRLTNLGFKHICCDDLIEERLAPLLKQRGYRGIKDISKWLGQPYDQRFQENQQKYLELEEAVMQKIFKNNHQDNSIVDTTGSVIYTSEDALNKVKNNSLIVYLQTSEEMKKEMFERYLKDPKPVLWGNIYHQNKDESQHQALARGYLKLLEQRSRLYEKLADLVIPFHEVKNYQIDENQFLKLIQEKL